MHESSRHILNHIINIVEDYGCKGYSMTVRQVYYQLVARNILENNLVSYNKTSRILTHARMEGLVSWDAIVDRMRKPVMPNQFDTMMQFVDAVKKSYRTYRWADQKYYVEVMVEKEALAGILEPITWHYNVSLLVNKGYVSASAIHEVAQRMKEQKARKKICCILYLGDHDPSGIDMVRDIRERLAEFGAEVYVERIALSIHQVRRYKLPPNRAKKSDSRFKKYSQKHGSESWELDALDPEVLAEILEENITKFLDMEKYGYMIKKENRAKVALTRIARKLSVEPNLHS